jgi:hypothetical protein
VTRPMPLTVAIIGFLGLAATILWLAASAFAAAQARSHEYRYLSEALDPVSAPAITVTWRPADRPLIRPFSRSDALLIGTALTQAWRAFAAVQDTGQSALLADHFSGPALDRATTAAAQARADGTGMVVLEQTARPLFQHLDGSIFQMTARATTLRYSLADGRLDRYELSVDEVVTTLMNETTGWRIFSHERTDAQPVVPPQRQPITLSPLRGVNYYPAETPWSRFWPEFDPRVIAADLDLVVGLNGNAVRIFLPLADIGPDAKGSANLLKLKDFLDLAQARDLAVIPTLFDLKSGYRTALWAEDVAYLRRVLPVLDAAPAVTLVDIKNQPDLDRAAHGEGLLQAWLTTMILMANDIAPDLPLTVGWSSAETAGDLVALLDAVSYHDYADPQGTAMRLAGVRAAAQGKPVLVSEIGGSSYSLVGGFPGSHARQAADLRDRLTQLSTADGVLVWTLHDFPAPEARAVGRSPWVLRLQAHFGLYDASGAAKPAAEVVARSFAELAAGD